jgi:hypothetical protein
MITRVRKERYQKWFTFNLEIIELPAAVLSPEAKNFWQYLFSRPDDWEYKRKAAINLLGSGHKVDKATSELKALQLLEIVQRRENGKFEGYDWIIKAEPVLPTETDPPEPDPESPDPDRPDPAIQDTLIEIPSLKEKTSLKERRRALDHEEFSEDENQESQKLIVAMMALASPGGKPLTAHQAENLHKRYGRAAIANQLDWLPFRKRDNPVAVFQAALRENLPAPKAWLDLQAGEKMRQESALKQEIQRAELTAQRQNENDTARQRREQLAAEKAAFDALSPEEQRAVLEERKRKRQELADKRRQTNPFTQDKAAVKAKMNKMEVPA